MCMWSIISQQSFVQYSEQNVGSFLSLHKKRQFVPSTPHYRAQIWTLYFIKTKPYPRLKYHVLSGINCLGVARVCLHSSNYIIRLRNINIIEQWFTWSCSFIMFQSYQLRNGILNDDILITTFM